MKENRLHKFMMNIAVESSKMSRARRQQVGVVLVKDNRIIANSWNGTISGQSNNCEIFRSIKSLEKTPLQDDEVITNCIDCEDWQPVSACPICDNSGKIVQKDKTSELTLHAEQNIISYCAKRGISTDGCTMFITLAPCTDCAKLIAQSGIKKVYYKKSYAVDGIDFLEGCGIIVGQLS